MFRFMALKQEIEVILFWKSKPVSLSNLAETLNCNPAEVKKGLMDLVREYELKDGGLQIAFRNNGYVMEPKDEYLNLAQKFVPVDLKVGALRTLALIALKEPVRQTDIIEVRGSGAYDHIRELVESDWLVKEQIGSTYTLRTTNAFRKYFRLSDSGDELKDKLHKIIEQVEKRRQELQEDEQALLLPESIEAAIETV